MNKKLGLLLLYALLIGSAFDISSRKPIENPWTIVIVIVSVLAILLTFVIRQRRQDL